MHPIPIDRLRRRLVRAGRVVPNLSNVREPWLHDWRHEIAEAVQTLVVQRTETGSPATSGERVLRRILDALDAEIARREKAAEHAREDQADGFHGDAPEWMVAS